MFRYEDCPEMAFIDKLKVEGINFKGFGIIPKFIMMDKDLTLEAKGIYAYFCSFAGNGDSAFPSRSKILADLRIGKDCYYIHFNLLLKEGYVIVNREKVGCFRNNIYTLVSNPKKFIDLASNKEYSRVRMTGLKSSGYGLIPKAVMIDPRLNLKAKSIYAYFASFTGAEDNSFPKVETILHHLNISETTYYKFYKTLHELDYIIVLQRRYDNGKMGVNDYYINENPKPKIVNLFDEHTENTKPQRATKNTDMDKKSPSPIFSDMDEKEIKALHTNNLEKKKDKGFVKQNFCQDIKKWDIEKRDIEEPYSRNTDNNINSININNININKRNISSSSLDNKEYIEGEDKFSSKEKVLSELKEKMNYEAQSKFFGKGYWQNRKSVLDGILDIMASVIYKPANFYTINQMPTEGVKVADVFSKSLGFREIMYVIDNVESYKASGGVIRSLRSFIITALFNSVCVMNLDYAFEENASNIQMEREVNYGNNLF